MKMPFFAKNSPALWAGVVLSCPIWALAQTAPALTAPAAPLYEQAKVLSSTPVVKQVQMQQRFCNNQPVEVSAPNTGAGAVIGALVGGAVGSAVGQGSGNAAATALGAVGGAILGNQAEGQGTRVQNAVTCTVQNTTQNVTVFHVVYEWGGKPYTVEPRHWRPRAQHHRAGGPSDRQCRGSGSGPGGWRYTVGVARGCHCCAGVYHHDHGGGAFCVSLSVRVCRACCSRFVLGLCLETPASLGPSLALARVR